MSIPELPERWVWISDATRTSSVTDFRAAVFDHNLVHRIVDDLVDVLNIFRRKTDPIFFGMCLILLFLFVIEACFSPNPPPVFVVGLLGVVQVTFPTYRYVHTESDAHVRVSELVVRIRGRKKVHVRVCWWTDGVVRADALRVVVLHVTVGALQQIYIFLLKLYISSLICNA